MREKLMQAPDQFSSFGAQGFTALVCWILAYRIDGALISLPVIDSADMIITFILKLLGAGATLTTILSFYIKNEMWIKRFMRKFKSKK